MTVGCEDSTGDRRFGVSQNDRERSYAIEVDGKVYTFLTSQPADLSTADRAELQEFLDSIEFGTLIVRIAEPVAVLRPPWSPHTVEAPIGFHPAGPRVCRALGCFMPGWSAAGCSCGGLDRPGPASVVNLSAPGTISSG